MSQQVETGLVLASYHTFWLSERIDDVPASGRRPSNGLVVPHMGAVEIWTGTHTGNVPVTVETRDDVPTTDDMSDWDDVVEVDVESVHGNLLVTSLFAHLPKELPNLAFHGAGLYRMRFYARGRDSDPTYDTRAPDEHHRVISWPVLSRTQEAVLKRTDEYGTILRAQASH
ncbi:MAG: hypothetical protein WBA97_31705 [Actinophytocola sp.]|uniref:hypothetical protein n=1 Tax=Actinophytocola sp. TaxID=1872138 RepID=UPI003C72BCC5